MVHPFHLTIASSIITLQLLLLHLGDSYKLLPSRSIARGCFTIYEKTFQDKYKGRRLRDSYSNNLPISESLLHMSLLPQSQPDVPDYLGDYVTMELEVGKDNIKVETPFDQGLVRFVINGGGYLGGIHRIASKLAVGETITELVDGPLYRSELAADIPIEDSPGGLKVGDVVQLANGLKAQITVVNDKIIRIDANQPLAGEKLTVKARMVDKKPHSHLEQVTVAAGCFWGVELAFQRLTGVAFTAVGYTQGVLENPSYEEVCSGSTGHTEAVTLLYDKSLIDFERILEVFWNRHDPTQLNQQGNDVGTQYRGGIYFHTQEQLEIARKSIEKVSKLYNKPIVTELLPANVFYYAESYHQQYLEKGRQSAKKEATEKIRCYG